MKYLVLHNCYGFQGMYWTRDEVVEINPKLNPPVEHFKPLEVPVPRVEPLPLPKPPVVAAKPVVKAPVAKVVPNKTK